MSNTESNPNNSKPVTYTQIKILGIGSFGKAYLVECNNDKSLAVIKTMIIENMDEGEKKEALLEAKILEKLDHPNIIKFREVFMARKPVFTLNIVMDFADGGDLQTKIKEQKGKHFTETQILDWFVQICLAIKHIHDKKILHRDLKSQNVFLTKNGLVKLGDFGIAKCLNYTLEKAKTVVGTPYYLSPEIVENRPYSFKSDIWSLGVLLYEMTCLKMPFDASSLPMLYVKIIRGAYSPIPNMFSKELRSLVSFLLTVDSEKRPSINDILKLPYLKNRIRNFLSEMEYNNEFSSTILKKYQNKSGQQDKNSNVISGLNQLSLNKDFGYESKPKSTNNNGFGKQPNDFKIDNKRQELYNVPTNKPVSQTPNAKLENKNGSDVSNELNYVKRKETDRRDIKDISDFIKNKKNDKKKNDLLQQQSNLSNNSNQSKEYINNTNVSASTNISDSYANKAKNVYNSNNNNQINFGNQSNIDSKYFDEPKMTKAEKNERSNDLKEFMKRKKKEKSMVSNEKDGIIWMKGMEDILNLNIDSSIYQENDNSPSNNMNNNFNAKKNSNSENYNYKYLGNDNKNIKNYNDINQNNNNYNNNYDNYKSEYNNYSDLKDKEDYLNVHKMYINLDNIEKELETDDFEINQEDLKINDINSLTRDYNIVSDNENQNNNNNNTNQINNIYIKNYNKNSYNVEDQNVNTDNCIIEELRIELEATLGLPLFKAVYNIVHDNTDPYLFSYDINVLRTKIRKELNNKFSNYDIEKAISKIPEIYSIISKEREMMYC